MTEPRIEYRSSPMHGRDHPARHETPSIDELARDIAGRLRPVCTHCDELEFIALVRRIAAIELKYKLSGGPRHFPAREG